MGGSLCAGQPTETIDVVLACLHRAFLNVVLVALLHASHHATASSVLRVVVCASEVWAEESAKRRYAWCCSCEAGNFEWVWWCKKDGSHDCELLHVWVLQITDATDPRSLERMSSGESWVGVIYSVKSLPLQATHLRVRNQVRVCVSLFLIFFGLSLPL